MNPDWTTVLIPLVIGGVFGVIGVGLLIFAQTQRVKARETEKWPTLNGTIASSRIDSRTTTERDEGRTYTRTTHTPMVEYTYELGGRTYRGNKIFPGANMSFDLGTAQEVVNRYQPGGSASVHYNPADPTQAVLETKPRSGSIMWILGGVFAVIGLVGCCAAGVLALMA